jgi:hypothetical protein
MGHGREVVKENSRRGRTNQCILTVGLHQETPLKIDFGINNEKQDLK